LLHFLNDKEKKNQTYIYSYRVCYIFLTFKFKFIFIYLLHVLFVLKIDGIFEKKNSSLYIV